MTAGTATSSPRPRVAGPRETEILGATLEVLAEVGFDRLTMAAVATAARASKATLYRRWNGKNDLVIEALLSMKGPVHLPDTGSLRGDLLAAFCSEGGLSDPTALAVFASILTAVGTDPEFASAFRERVLGPRIEVSEAIYTRALARGELRDDLDLAVIAPALAGIVLHRTFLLGEMPTPEVIAAVVDQVILPAALAAPPA